MSHDKAAQDTVIDTDSVSEFVQRFAGDATEAIRAIERWSQEASKQPAKPSRELGEVLVSVRDLTKQYKIGHEKVNALAGVSLDIHQGEFVALTGASGSGKSTLLQLMGGLDKPTSGAITIAGTSLTKMSDSKLSKFRGQTIGFVFQFFYLQSFLDLGQNLEVPAMFARTKRSLRKERVTELASAVNLGDRVNHRPKELSGGQMQRAAIARALFNNPKLILADEPTGNLDSANSHAIIQLFEEIRDKFGTTIVMVTHDRDIARRADREITLKDGLII